MIPIPASAIPCAHGLKAINKFFCRVFFFFFFFFFFKSFLHLLGSVHAIAPEGSIVMKQTFWNSAVLCSEPIAVLSMRVVACKYSKEHLNIKGFTSGLTSSHLTVQQSIGGLRWSKRFCAACRLYGCGGSMTRNRTSSLRGVHNPPSKRVTTMRAATSVPSLVPSPVMLLHQPCLHARAQANLSLHYGIQRICARNLLLRLVPACCQLQPTAISQAKRRFVRLCSSCSDAMLLCWVWMSAEADDCCPLAITVSWWNLSSMVVIRCNFHNHRGRARVLGF